MFSFDVETTTHKINWQLFLFLDINECTSRPHNCAQVCINTAGSFTCSCNSGYTLAADGRSCSREESCGGTLIKANGSFQTPGWPHRYPQANFKCEWIIEFPDTEAAIEFTFDNTAYGINGRPPCRSDYIEFFDGMQSNASSIIRLCKFKHPQSITTTSSQARVVFAATINPQRPASRVGVKVNYKMIYSGTIDTPKLKTSSGTLFTAYIHCTPCLQM